MIEEGIKNGTYPETDDATKQDHKQFQDCLNRNKNIWTLQWNVSWKWWVVKNVWHGKNSQMW